MKEILFRGKCTITGKWAYGNYLKEETNSYITYNYNNALGDFGTRNKMVNNVIVVPETVGQYTGLADEQGKKIFEWDILKTISSTLNGKREDEAIVMYDDNKACYKLKVLHGGKYKRISNFTKANLYCYKGEVIGNIHDNPELLEVTK